MKAIILTNETFRNLEAGNTYQYQTVTFEVTAKTPRKNASSDYTVIINGVEKTVKIGKLKTLVGCVYKKEYKLSTQGGEKVQSEDVIKERAKVLRDKFTAKFNELSVMLQKYNNNTAPKVITLQSMATFIDNYEHEQLAKLEAIRKAEEAKAKKQAEEAAVKAAKIAELSAKIQKAVAAANWAEVTKLSLKMNKLTK